MFYIEGIDQYQVLTVLTKKLFICNTSEKLGVYVYDCDLGGRLDSIFLSKKLQCKYNYPLCRFVGPVFLQTTKIR